MNDLHTRSFSFEFFPPKTEAGLDRLVETAQALSQVRPEYVSVTFGAGGSSREGTYQTVRRLGSGTALEVVPHLSCIGITRADILPMLQRYRALGVKRIVALRGDLPTGQANNTNGDFRYANELVAYLKELGGFSITVAAYPEFHPQAPNAHDDMQNFVRKARAGADQAITQYFFNNDAYYAFVDAVRRFGVEIPVIAGVMPVTDYQQIVRFSAFCGAEIPRWMRMRMEAFADDPSSQKALGLEIATRQVEDLLQKGAPGIHFYTLNKAEPTLRVLQNLGIPSPFAKLLGTRHAAIG